MTNSTMRDTSSVERLEAAAARCEALFRRLVACDDDEALTRVYSELEDAIGDRSPGDELSFASAAMSFDLGCVSAYERGVDLVYYACGEGPEWVWEARRESYVTMLCVVFGVGREEVMRDVERVRASYETVDRIQWELSTCRVA